LAERKTFEAKMRQEYKLKKERWKNEMAKVDTPKRQREAVLSQHKENFKEQVTLLDFLWVCQGLWSGRFKLGLA